MHAIVRHGLLRHVADFEPVGPGVQLEARRPCVVETDRGLEVGLVLAASDGPRPREVRPLLRMATGDDEASWARGREQADELLERLRALQLHAAFHPLAAERLLEDERLHVHYVSSGPLHLPPLLRSAEQALGLPLTLTQLGARQRARLCGGGCGVCGQSLCCSTFLRELIPVSLRTAQAQGLDQDPERLAGACGRLKCCLRYEAPQYEAAARELPRVGWQVSARRVRGTVLAVDALRRRVLVQPAERNFPVSIFADEVLRAGPPPRTPLPVAGAPVPPPARPEVERGWSEIARRFWQRWRGKEDGGPGGGGTGAPPTAGP